jgi:phosphoketolase
VHFVEGDDPARMHQAFAATLETCYSKIRDIQRQARNGIQSNGSHADPRPRWPAIVLRTPKGWTGPKEVDGLPVEGTFRAHQVPLEAIRSEPRHLAMLEPGCKAIAPINLPHRDAEDHQQRNHAASEDAPNAALRTTMATMTSVVEDVSQHDRDNCCADQYDRHHARKLPHQDLPAARSPVVLNLVSAVLRQTPLHLGLSKA